MPYFEKDYIPILKRGEAAKIWIKDIVYIETDGRKITINTDVATISIYSKLNEIETFLDSRFYKCHSRCIINLDKVVKMKKGEIIFEDAREIYISSHNFAEMLKCYKKYISNDRTNDT